ncbi:MAG: hypothetical protein WDW38_006547 [Sanguina aurantia]
MAKPKSTTSAKATKTTKGSLVHDSPLVSTKTQDFLEQDLPIRGQKYAVVSFVSPEAVLKSKEVFTTGQFLKSLANDVETMFVGVDSRFAEDPVTLNVVRGLRERYAYLWSADLMQAEYHAFSTTNEAQLHEDFTKLDGSLRTSIRGLKIRGVYESESEARNRIKVIQTTDSLFNVYMMEVGCWCPWDPNPDAVVDNEYGETMLNTLVKGYKENNTQKDIMYEQRKSDMMERMGQEKDVWDQRRKENAKAESEELERVTQSLAVQDVTPDLADGAVAGAEATAPLDEVDEDYVSVPASASVSMLVAPDASQAPDGSDAGTAQA